MAPRNSAGTEALSVRFGVGDTVGLPLSTPAAPQAAVNLKRWLLDLAARQFPNGLNPHPLVTVPGAKAPQASLTSSPLTGVSEFRSWLPQHLFRTVHAMGEDRVFHPRAPRCPLSTPSGPMHPSFTLNGDGQLLVQLVPIPTHSLRRHPSQPQVSWLARLVRSVWMAAPEPCHLTYHTGCSRRRELRWAHLSDAIHAVRCNLRTKLGNLASKAKAGESHDVIRPMGAETTSPKGWFAAY